MPYLTWHALHCWNLSEKWQDIDMNHKQRSLRIWPLWELTVWPRWVWIQHVRIFSMLVGSVIWKHCLIGEGKLSQHVYKKQRNIKLLSPNQQEFTRKVENKRPCEKTKRVIMLYSILFARCHSHSVVFFCLTWVGLVSFVPKFFVN